MSKINDLKYEIRCLEDRQINETTMNDKRYSLILDKFNELNKKIEALEKENEKRRLREKVISTLQYSSYGMTNFKYVDSDCVYVSSHENKNKHLFKAVYEWGNNSHNIIYIIADDEKEAFRKATSEKVELLNLERIC